MTEKWRQTKAQFNTALYTAMAARNEANNRIVESCGQVPDWLGVLNSNEPEDMARFQIRNKDGKDEEGYNRLRSLGKLELGLPEPKAHWFCSLNFLAAETQLLASLQAPEIWEALWAEYEELEEGE